MTSSFNLLDDLPLQHFNRMAGQPLQSTDELVTTQASMVWFQNRGIPGETIIAAVSSLSTDY